VKAVATSDPHNLQRFLDAQDGHFEAALGELRAGSKQSHWMWFIFPQLAGLGRSPTAQFYGLASLEEAHAYLDHALLGPRLRQAVAAMIAWVGKRSADEILGPVDAMKLRSSLSLFDQVAPNDLFAGALAGFFDGAADERTLALLEPTR
jgi:uncharacterized protein (DUF1810 family)